MNKQRTRCHNENSHLIFSTKLRKEFDTASNNWKFIIESLSIYIKHWWYKIFWNNLKITIWQLFLVSLNIAFAENAASFRAWYFTCSYFTNVDCFWLFMDRQPKIDLHFINQIKVEAFGSDFCTKFQFILTWFKKLLLKIFIYNKATEATGAL